METAAGVAIAREAARLVFLCGDGSGSEWPDFPPERVFTSESPFDQNSESPFDQEKAELLVGIREEVQRYAGIQDDVRLDVYREVLAHLAGGVDIQNRTLTIQ